MAWYSWSISNDATQIGDILGMFYTLASKKNSRLWQIIHAKEIFEFNMFDQTGRIIDIVASYENLHFVLL